MVGRAVQLPRVLVEAARALARIRVDRRRVADDGQKPGDEGCGGDDERGEREAARSGVAPFPEPAHGDEAREGEPEEQRVRRMDGRERERRGRGGSEQGRRGAAHRLERERERGRDEDLP